MLSYTGCAAAVQARPGLCRVSGSHSQGTLGYHLPARSSILRTAMTDTRIVTTAYRYKRPPRKRKAVAIAGPANDLDPAYVVQLREGGHNDGLQTSRHLVPDDLA